MMRLDSDLRGIGCDASIELHSFEGGDDGVRGSKAMKYGVWSG